MASALPWKKQAGQRTPRSIIGKFGGNRCGMLSLCTKMIPPLVRYGTSAYLRRLVTCELACPYFMRWNEPDRRHNPLGRDAPASTAWVRNQGLEQVRHAMIQSLAGLSGSEVARMGMRLRYASDIEALWYLRGDLLTMLVPLQGEPLAHATMNRLTPLFHGQLPCALSAPPGSGSV